MKFIILILFFSIFSCHRDKSIECDYISNYYQKIYKADLEFQTGHYDQAFISYQEAFKSCPPINVPTYNEIGNFAKTCAMLGKNQLAITFIKKDIKRGYDIKWLLQDSDFKGVFESEEGKDLIANFENLRDDALSNLLLELREEIKVMQIEDQRYRNGNYQANIEKQHAIDEDNSNRLIEIFEEIGLPNDEVIGGYSVDETPVGIGGILLHTSDSIRMHYFIPKLKKFVRLGTCPPNILGTVIDQYFIYNGEPQINGTYTKEGGGYSDMISDLEQVDNNRISIGLPPLKIKEKKDSILRSKHPDLFN